MKRKIFILVLLGVITISARAQENDVFALRPVIQKYLEQSNSNFHFAMLAEVYRNDTAVVFFWPCIKDSAFADDKIYALKLERENEEWTPVGLSSEGKAPDQKEFLRLIGGDDFELKKPGGLSADSLGWHIQHCASNIAQTINNKKPEETVHYIEELSKAFSLRICGFSNQVALFALRGLDYIDVNHETDEEGKTYMEIYFHAEAKLVHAKLAKSSNGWVIDSLEENK